MVTATAVEWLVFAMYSVAIVFSFMLSVFSAPAPAPSTEDSLTFAKAFMSRFGYLEDGGSDSESLVRVDLAIKDVQRFGGIEQTGKLDNSTLQLMKSPRCGLPDILPSKPKRNKRYALAPSLGWRKRHVTYFISNWSPKIGKEAVRVQLDRALSVWARYSRLKFLEVTSPEADIIVAFGSGYHGDPYPFDGPGLTLAHAYFPGEFGSFGGDIHFDEDESWKINPGVFEDGVDFFSVAVHEIGHSLGLSHSAADGSIMNPYYRLTDSKTFSLGYDDILAMYELYIKKPLEGGDESDENDKTQETTKRTTSTTSTRKPTTTTTKRPEQKTTLRSQFTYTGDDESVDDHKRHDPFSKVPAPEPPLMPKPPKKPNSSPSNKPSHCQGHYDAISYLRGELFVFKNDNLWRLSRPGKVEDGYPVSIHRMFYKLPQSLQRIDAAYERKTDSNIIFFSGDKYWVYNGNDIVGGAPKSIYDYGLPRYVKKVDAVMVWANNMKTYIFSENRFWRFNEDTQKMDPGYPKSMHLFKGVPSNLDSAMTWSDGVTYFFKNDLYWAFNNTWLKTEAFYPQSASHYWLGCH